jgi:hypothetical protein
VRSSALERQRRVNIALASAMLICAAAALLALLLRNVKLGGPAPVGHRSEMESMP